MNRRTLALFPVVLMSLACGDALSLFPDINLEGKEAIDRIGKLSGSPLPPSTQHAQVGELTGIDWLAEGVATVPRGDAEAWFTGLNMPCDTATTPARASVWTLPFLFEDAKRYPLNAPYPQNQPGRRRECRDSTYSGPHYDVWITDQGDPAYIAIQVMTL